VSDTKPHTTAPVAAAGGNFLRAGSNEIRRQLDRYSLNQKLRQLARDRDAALGALGEKAWEAKIDLAPFPEIQSHLQGVSARSGELAATAGQLESQKAALEDERRNAVERGKARRDAVEAKKRPVDASLTAVRNRSTDGERARTLAQARLAAIATELAAATRDAGTVRSPAGAQSTTETAEQRQTRLLSEQTVVKERLAAAEAELPGLATQIAQLQAETSQYAAEIAAIVKEQNETTARLDGELGRMRSGLQAASQAQSQVGKERSDLYRKLGQALFESQIRPEALKESVQRVAMIDAGRAELEGRLQASVAETQTLPQGTMSKFWGAIVGVPLVVIALAWGASSLLQQQPVTAPATTIAEQPVNVDPQNEKDRTVLRFVQAGKTSDADTRDSAVRILREDILTMGATADQNHLPILVKVLRSSEPDLREAAANAIGMIGPTANETNALAQLLPDPVEPVAQAARRALQASPDPAAVQLLANAGSK
jgi:hypothetical protein